MSAWVVWAPILTAVAGGAGTLAVLEWRRQRRWAAEDDASEPIVPERRPLPYPRWPNTATTALVAGDILASMRDAREREKRQPPLTDDDGGRRGD